MSYNYIERLRDGKLVLLTRNDKKTIYCRYRVKGKRDYDYRTCDTDELVIARSVATDIYDDVRYREKHKLPVNNLPFKQLFELWYDTKKTYLSLSRQRFIEGTVRRYLIPFFKDIKATELDDHKVEEYWSFRMNYYIDGIGVEIVKKAEKSKLSQNKRYKNKKGNVAKTPSQQTLKMEQSLIKEILYWCNRFGHINYLPLVKAPQIQAKHITNRRPAFTRDEWKVLHKHIRKWSSVKPSKSNRVTKQHYHQRQMLRHYVLILCNTGIRIGEARELRWCDIEEMHQDGEDYTVLKIRETTKTGKREVIAMEKCKLYLDRIKKFSEFTKKDDFVFCGYTGKPVASYGKTFQKVLMDCDLLHDNEGKVRTLYSLRHTYATFRLTLGKLTMDEVALNMGTSVNMIEKHYSHVTTRNIADRLTHFVR